MNIPECFCWTRYGPEAGESFSSILARKERERQASGGVFIWGIGNGLGPSMKLLVDMAVEPTVVFSPIRSRPRSCDLSPAAVTIWTHATTMTDEPYTLPEAAYVTSRQQVRPRPHYALVCRSDRPLKENDGGDHLYFGGLRNLRTGTALGASQVTAVVKRDPNIRAGNTYSVAFIAQLCPPYFVRLLS